MPYLSRKGIEEIAQRAVAAYKKLPVFKEKQLRRVEPEIFVWDLLGLCLRVISREMLGRSYPLLHEDPFARRQLLGGMESKYPSFCNSDAGRDGLCQLGLMKKIFGRSLPAS